MGCSLKSRGQAATAGEFEIVRTKDGIFDMSGNLWEWTSGNTLDCVVVVGNSVPDLDSVVLFGTRSQLSRWGSRIPMLCECHHATRKLNGLLND